MSWGREMDERVEELLPVYALGGLTAEERAAVERYLAASPDARAELDGFLETVAQLPYAVTPLAPSQTTTDALLARVQADAAAARRPVQTVASAPARLSFWDGVRAFLARPAVGGVGLALAAVLLVWGLLQMNQIRSLEQQTAYFSDQMQALAVQNGALNDEVTVALAENATLSEQMAALSATGDELTTAVDELTDTNAVLEEMVAQLQQENNTLVLANDSLTAANAEFETQLVAQQEVIDLIQSPTVYAVTLPGTETQPGAEAKLVVDQESKIALLVVEGMGELPQDEVYQVLLIRGTEHATADTFRVNTSGRGVLLVRSEEPIDSFDAVGVSIEPQGGSVQRTGDVVLLGALEAGSN